MVVMSQVEYAVRKVRILSSGEDIWNTAYMPVSMNNWRMRSVKNVLRIFDAISTYTTTFPLLVGDYLHRNNLKAFNGLSDSEAVTESLKQGEAIIAILNEAIALRPKLKCNIIRFQSIYDDSRFRHFYLLLRQEIRENESFHQGIEKTISLFIERQMKVDTIPKDARLACENYILEELAAFLVLKEDGLNTNIYPGSQLLVLKDILHQKIVLLGLDLTSLNLVEIKFKKLPCT